MELSNPVKSILFILLGMLLMFIILKYMSAKGSGMAGTGSGTSAAVKSLLKTQQFANLVRTGEFREMVKTSEFQKVLTTLAQDELNAVAKTLMG